MPAMPPGIATVILTGRYVRPDGTPLRGTLKVAPPASLTFPAADTISTGAASIPLDENGAFSVALIATDQPGMAPADWTYQVEETFAQAEGRTFAIKLPSTPPVVDIADIAPADPDHGDYVLVPGPAGAAGSQIYSGAGAPPGTTGVNGDYWIDTTPAAVKLYGPKVAGAWPSTGVALGGSSNIITSVNSKTGAVVLTAADVGAYPATGGNLTGSLTATAGLRVNTTDVNVNALITDSPVGSAARVAVMRVGGVDQFSLNAVGALTVAGGVTAGSGSTSVLPNLKLGSSSASLGGAVGGATAVPNVTTAPSFNPTGGVVVYAEGGVLKVRQSDGTTAVVANGLTQATADARYPLQTRSARMDKGIYVPPGWGATWRAKRDAAGTAQAKIAVVGGSASQGFYASNPHTKSWPGVVRTALQSSYGDGGSGFMSSSMSSTVLSSGDAAALAAWTSAGAIIGQSGAWLQGGSKYGPGVNYLYADTTGASLTFTVRGTTAKIYTVSGGGARAAFTYQIDGGTAVNVADSGISASNIQVTTITGLSNASHTVKVTWAGTATGTGQNLSVCGVSGENATGVIVHNLALAGAMSSTYANNATTALNATWNGGVDFPADLVIFTAGPNDATNNTTGDAWAANVAKYLKAVKDTGTANGSTDVMFLLPHLGTHDTTNFKYQDYATRALALAHTYNAAFVDMWTIGDNSWQAWNALGYWGTSAGSGAAGADSVHLSDAGFAFMANQILPILTS
ncbi:GDSL-type esterase/lipase family protein [Streptomyces sp. NPDC058254]|uniref:GDSL-type esterase/lipase family protein n=1 Tax=Streptomyces sp. NPDC058254 TaxID=3346406 RepID=UPI0036EC9D6A